MGFVLELIIISTSHDIRHYFSGIIATPLYIQKIIHENRSHRNRKDLHPARRE